MGSRKAERTTLWVSPQVREEINKKKRHRETTDDYLRRRFRI